MFYSHVGQGGVALAPCLLKLEKWLIAHFPDGFTCEDDIFGEAQKLLSRLSDGGIESENELFERIKNLEENSLLSLKKWQIRANHVKLTHK